MRAALAVVAAIAALAFDADQAKAQSMPCYPRQPLIDQLARQHGERPAHRGLTAAGHVVEVLVSPKTGTFTFLMTRPNGVACVVGAGTDWTLVLSSKDQDPKS